MWTYKNNPIENISDFGETTPYGFIYITTHIPTGIKYIGKKSLFHNKKKKLTKKELSLQSGPGRKPTHKIQQVESDWKSYYGSEQSILKNIKEGRTNEFKREILMLVYNKKLLTYYECKYLFEYGVLEKPKEFLNNNILGKFFSSDFFIK